MTEDRPNQFVIIIGKQQLQNSLLSEFISKHNVSCLTAPSIAEHIPPYDIETAEVLFLIDIADTTLDNALEELTDISGNVKATIFNVPAEEDLDKFAGQPFINGVFQRNCPQEQLIKGINAIFEGEVWLPRRTLSNYVVKNRNLKKTYNNSDVSLTDREIEVLKVMATGAKNAEIADTLNLSPHTIKTHIYNIFKKINSSNRLQAVNWAQENL